MMISVAFEYSMLLVWGIYTLENELQSMGCTNPYTQHEMFKCSCSRRFTIQHMITVHGQSHSVHDLYRSGYLIVAGYNS